VKGAARNAAVDRTQASLSSEGSGDERRLQRRNAANPFRYRDATSPGLSCGETCRGGEKPRGWNEQTGWNRAAEGDGNIAGSGRRRACRRRGEVHTNNLTRGKSRGSGQPHPRHFGPIRVALETRPSTREAHERGKTLRTRSETSKVERGAAKSKRAATESMAGTHHFRENVEGPTHSEVHVNVTRAATTLDFG
jgi:hypothetical protein